MDTALVPLGERAGPLVAYCDADEIAAFALAINDPNPLYQEGRATPPTYAVVPVFPAFMGVSPIPPEATVGMTGGVHGTHDLFIHRPIEPGMHLHVTAERCSITTSSAGMNVATRLMATDAAGELHVEMYWSSLMRGPVTGGDRGEAMADHAFPEEARSELLDKASLATTRDQTFRYAGASGDRATMHVNDEVAQRYGFQRKFNQGLCTLGVTSRGLVEMTAANDPRRIRRIAVRFAAPTFPGDDIEVAVFDLGTTDTGLHSYAFEATSRGRVVLRHGRVEVDE
jgi:acyl dehydratase